LLSDHPRLTRGFFDGLYGGRTLKDPRTDLPSSPLDTAGSDPYQVLGVGPQASGEEIKAAYRALVKQHHPDAGGDDTTILALNAAWEVLGDGERRRRFDQQRRPTPSSVGKRTTPASPARAADSEEALARWLSRVYTPVDRLLGQVINPFSAELRALAADPYDDSLMEAFCAFLEQGQARLARAETLYRSHPAPAAGRELSLELYHCLSLLKDALVDLERFTMGYVDSYLRDGRELLRKAKARRKTLKHSSLLLGR
jgi:molecular chaperone DnaJ